MIPPRSRARMKCSSASESCPFIPSRSLSLKLRGSYRPSSSQIRVPVMPHSSRSWCQSAELRASREHSRPSTIPAQGDLGDQVLEAFPVGGGGAGVALVDVDDGDLVSRPAQADRLAAQV